MKRKSSLKVAIAAASIAASLGAAQASQPILTSSPAAKVEEIKSSHKTATKKAVISQVKTVGGLDLVHENYSAFGMTPKEYGMLYGRGNSKKKSNMLRVSKRTRAKHKRK